MPARQPFRQKFQRWPNQPPRWNPMAPQHQQQNPFQRTSGPVMRPPAHMMPGSIGGPQRQMRPGFLAQSRPAFFNNNFMQQSRGPLRQPMTRQRFFYPAPGPIGDQPMQNNPPYVPSPILAGGNVGQGSALPRKVLINPNFKGGVEAAKSKFISQLQLEELSNSFISLRRSTSKGSIFFVVICATGR